MFGIIKFLTDHLREKIDPGSDFSTLIVFKSASQIDGLQRASPKQSERNQCNSRKPLIELPETGVKDQQPHQRNRELN